jgi:universal stress protein E
MFDASHIMVAIADPTAPKTAALKRALEIAQQTGARVTLFTSLYSPYLASEQFYTPAELERDIQAAVLARKAALDVLAKEFVDAGVSIHVRCRWDYPPHESIVREVLREKVDLLIADSHRHGFAARMVLSNTDWQLIRLCPCPLLLTKQDRAYENIRVLTCVDPLHEHAKPAALDEALITTGQSLANTFNGQLHVAHFYMVADPMPTGFMVEPLPLPADIVARHVREVKHAFEALVQRFKLARKQTHVRAGVPVSELPDLAKELDVQVVVMGAVSRTGLQRLFIGSTAERVIDELSCDVLIVKPVGFKTTVSETPLTRPMVLPPL